MVEDATQARFRVLASIPGRMASLHCVFSCLALDPVRKLPRVSLHASPMHRTEPVPLDGHLQCNVCFYLLASAIQPWLEGTSSTTSLLCSGTGSILHLSPPGVFVRVNTTPSVPPSPMLSGREPKFSSPQAPSTHEINGQVKRLRGVSWAMAALAPFRASSLRTLRHHGACLSPEGRI